ncbi:uncharacterized protein LOC127247155 [Andrographis paniculata]|uniref:uncharacterized protein LOC127247155 n=1 Tax=Andrographis paniculata TaxID=175694 RepID=UPI0021E7CD44|nr:uncharacterized protein LOC127247155 [Andrographis paniculata]
MNQNQRGPNHDALFKLTMAKRWREVAEIYRRQPAAHTAKLTKSEETALHIAVSSYHSKHPSSSAHVEEMIDLVEGQVFTMQNVKGDTPLHLAAAVGWVSVCARIAAKNRELIHIRNENGETPLFVAAHHGNLQSFLCLHQELIRNSANNGELSVEALRRRKDGNTVLHSAISGEYYRLAYQIIIYYPKLVNSINVEGESPLHVLARKPNAFKSCSHFGFYDSFIYYCVFVDELKEEKYNPSAQSSYVPGGEINLPENYRTCVDIFFLLWSPIMKSFLAGFPRFKRRNSDSIDEERQRQNESEEIKRERKHSYPPNYTTCVLIFKFVTKVVLTIAGVGFWRIKKIRDKKERYSHAYQIMRKMIENEAGYIYENTGERPPERDELDHLESIPNLSDDHKEQIKDTALLVAAKMGIPEMVKKIISKCPVAIEDLDANKKNVLMLAAENRQTSVLDYLLSINLPEYMFHQIDDEGNSILHLAAMMGAQQPWSIPGAALQMQWEIKWYKHVKRSVPPMSFTLNSKRETPRNVFTRTHQSLVKDGNEWLIKTSESCSVVAALIAAVSFATAATVPGGLDQTTGYPILWYQEAFHIFSIASLMALCLSVTALVFFLAIITSRCEERDFKKSLPTKLLMGLTSLFASIASVLLSFCAGHTLILSEKLKYAAWPIYAVASFPVTFFAVAQLPLYFDLLWAACRKVPLRSYKVFY